MSDDKRKDPRDPNKPLGLRREDLEAEAAKDAAKPAADASSDAPEAAADRPRDDAPAADDATPSAETPAAATPAAKSHDHPVNAPPLSEQRRAAAASKRAASTPALPSRLAPANDPDADVVQPEFERPGGLLSKVDGHLIMYHDPASVQAEQYRACRTRLTAMNRVGAPWALVVTSSRSGEGRSTTTANLAACLAELPGTRVCLLEVDGRSPEQAEIFGVHAAPGMVDHLEGNASLKDVLRTTLLQGVDLIPAGSEPENPAELLGERKFLRLVDELKRRYTWVLIDAPPVHPYTDACVVTPHTEGALLVVRLGETPREMVSRSIENIEAAGGKVIGSFVTGRVPGAEDEERLGDYAYELDFDPEAAADPRVARERKDAEKRLRKQELAHLKQQKKQDRRDDLHEV